MNKETTDNKPTTVSYKSVVSNGTIKTETDTTTSSDFSRKNIVALGNLVRLTDSDEENKLDLFCYVKCDNSDSDLLKQCRGVVFNEDKLVMKAFPYTSEYVGCDDNLKDKLGDIKEYKFYQSYEGALIRVFNFNDKWYVSTHRKLNAFKSKWATKDSFGTLFKNALSAEENRNEDFKLSLGEGENILDRFLKNLDIDKKYMFLVCNNKDNRIVCQPPDEPTLYHVGTYVDDKFNIEEKINIPKPVELEFKSVDEISDYVDTINHEYFQGIICFRSDNFQCKIFNRNYMELFKIRGNEPSIKFRYIQLRMNKRALNKLYYLYPDMNTVFDDYENVLYEISRSIYKAYVQRFIKKRYVTVPREEFQVIRDCHTWHLSERTKNRISLDRVIKMMNQQSPTNLNHMIRRYKNEQLRKTDQQETMRTRVNSITDEGDEGDEGDDGDEGDEDGEVDDDGDENILIENSPDIKHISTPNLIPTVPEQKLEDMTSLP